MESNLRETWSKIYLYDLEYFYIVALLLQTKAAF